MVMTKERILLVFKDINQMYNNSGMYDGLAHLLDELIEEAWPRWIPCAERLPEEYGEYMITWTTSNSLARKECFLGIAEYELTGEYDVENNRFKGEWLLEDYVKNYPDVKVIAWMPLPEPYKAESEEV